MLITLKQARLIREKSQCEMAECLGIHVQTYRRIEENPDNATIWQAKKIADFLDVHYDHIFFANKVYLK